MSETAATETTQEHAAFDASLPMSARPLGEILMLQAGLSAEHLEEALRTQGEKGGRIGKVLVDAKRVNEDQLAKGLAAQFELDFLPRPAVEEVELELLQKVPIGFAKGSLLSFNIEALKSEPAKAAATLIYAPGPRESIEQVVGTRQHLLVSVYENVKGGLMPLPSTARHGLEKN